MRAILAALLLPLPHLAAAARPAGELVLDAIDPIVVAHIDGMAVRLRVDPMQNDTVEVTPALAARLAGPFERGSDIDVGRTTLAGRAALARLEIAGTTSKVTVATHDGAALGDADGVIGPEQLPHARIFWRRADAPPPTRTLTLPIAVDDLSGLSAPAPEIRALRLRFAMTQRSSGTAAAGVLLARIWSGAVGTDRIRIPLVFGVERPGRVMHFARPGTLAGFPIALLPIRTADYAGDTPPLVAPPRAAPGEVLVTHPLPPQREWRAVTLGSDLLARCAELAYDRLARQLTLRCAPDAR